MNAGGSACYANVNTPVAAGKIVKVFGELIVNWAVESVQKQRSFPAPAPVEFRTTAKRILFSAEPEAV